MVTSLDTIKISMQHASEVQFKQQMLWMVHESVSSLLFFDR